MFSERMLVHVITVAVAHLCIDAGRGRAGEGAGMGVLRGGDSGGAAVLQRGVAHGHPLRAEFPHGPPHQHRAQHCRAAAVRALPAATPFTIMLGVS